MCVLVRVWVLLATISVVVGMGLSVCMGVGVWVWVLLANVSIVVGMGLGA